MRSRSLKAVTSFSGGGSLSPEVLAERLLLVMYAYGTNTGIKIVALAYPPNSTKDSDQNEVFRRRQQMIAHP
ncbi:hypothetical protein, partial [Streptomyces chiangmaiensis]|uniref:hypothetical protein n=1 Tax=Streptomyces chiangmaiensis TaxID=766497 RepID=UPI0031E60721